MADVILETTGTNDLRPKETANRNLIPHVDEPDPPEGTNALGTPDDPWYGATFTSANYNFMYHCNYEYDRIIMGFEVIPNWTTTYGRVNIMQSDSESGLAVTSMRQMAETAPMMVFAGSEAGNQTATISTYNGGQGSVDGPLRKGGAPFGWKFVKMMKIRVNSSDADLWIPIYEKE